MGAALLVDNAYHQLIFTLVLIWASFGLSWNMLSGYTGLVLGWELKQLAPPPRVLIYSAFAEPQLSLAAALSGAAFLL